jgi:hypothetical protein
MIKAEIIQDKAVLLDHTGRVWQVEIGDDGEPTIQLLERIDRQTSNHLMRPVLGRYMA